MVSISLSAFTSVSSSRKQQGTSTQELHSLLVSLHRSYHSRRSGLTDIWYDCYLKYLASNPLASGESLAAAQRITGISGRNWRARYVGSKAFDQVETIVSYFMGAMFPSNKYFGLKPLEPIESTEWETVLELVRLRLADSLRRNKFSIITETFLRELVITGTSAVCTPWANGNTNLVAWSPFDIYLDPNATDPNAANVIRTYEISKGEYLALFKSGAYPYGSEKVDASYKPFSGDMYSSAIKALQGIDSDSIDAYSSQVSVYEFWGDLVLGDGTTLYNIVAQFTDSQLLNVYSNDYGDKRPFVFCRYIPVTKTPYGLGAIQPVLGQLSAIDVLMNRKADSVTLQTDQVYTYVEGGIVDPDLLDISPGAMIPVTVPNAINPLPTQSTNLQISVSEQLQLEQAVDKATGTGPYVGINAGRTQERVTATEVTAQKDAGGVRLSTRYSHINEEFFVPFLNLYLALHQTYSSEVYYVRLGIESGPGKYYAVPPAMLQVPTRVYAIGSGHLTDKEFTIRQILQWAQVVSANPALAQQVNWNSVLSVFTHLMVPEYAESMITKEQEPAQAMQGMQGPVPPESPLSLRQEQALSAVEQAGVLPELAQGMGASLGLNEAAPQPLV